MFTGLRREAIWTDNLAQVVRWAADSARLRPDDHGLVLSTYTTLAGLMGIEILIHR